ncbi:hypothetical protein AB0O00_32835, partial [Kitasatospora sp. NPDC093558]
GTLVEGLRDGVTAAVDAYARGLGVVAADGAALGAGRVCAGLTAVVSVHLERPEFNGSLRDVLGNAAVRARVAQAVGEHLGAWLRAHPESGAAVVGRVVGAV